MNRRRILSLVPLLLGLPRALAADTPASSFSFSSFVRRVGESHPAKSLEKQTIRELEETASRSGSLPDPTIQLGRENQGISLLNDMNTMEEPKAGEMETSPKPAKAATPAPAWSLGITQEFPWKGTLERQTIASRSQVRVAESDVALSDAERRLAAAELYVDLAMQQQTLNLEKLSLKEAEQVATLQNLRRSQGLGTHTELLAIQTDLEILKTEIASQEGALRSRKALALTQAGIALTEKQDFSPSFPSIPLSKEDLGALAGDGTDLTEAGIKARLESKLATLDTVRDRERPSVMGSLALMRDDAGMYMMNAMVGIRVPLFSGKVASSAMRSQEISTETTARERSWYQTRKELALVQARQRIEQAERNLHLLRSRLIPMTNDHFRVLLSDFAQGKASFFDLNGTRRNLLRLRTALARAEGTLVQEHLQMQRIAVGLADSTLDRPQPSLALGGEMGAAPMGADGGGGMPASGRMGSGSKMPQKGPAARPMPQQPEDNTPEGPAGGGMSGM